MIIHRMPADHSEALALLKPGAPPCLVFKHSPTCGVSTRAYTEVSVFADAHPGVPVFLVDVKEQRGLSQQIAAELRLPHESPQVILVVDGRPLWNASHGGVTGQAMDRALARLLPGHAEGEDGLRTIG